MWQSAQAVALSSRLCYLATGQLVRVDLCAGAHGGPVAHVSGVHHCGSPWACPICAPVVRERRAQEVDLALSSHLAGGGSGLFITQTVRHSRPDRLEPRVALMSSALNATLQGRSWATFKRQLGFVGAIRVVEVTYGQSGWHPHSHSVFVLEAPVCELEDFGAWIRSRWASVCERRGFGTLSATHGVDVRPVVVGDGLGGYLAKVEGGWGVGQELARGDVKRSGRTPFSILRDAALAGDCEAARLWHEYEAATFNKRFLRWSPGLRARLLPNVEELTDIEAASAEGVGVVLVSVLFEGRTWDVYVRAGWAGGLLAELERAAVDGDLPDVLDRWHGMLESDLRRYEGA